LGSLQSWLHRHEAGWRPDIARREEARGARKPEQPRAAVEHEQEYDGERSAAMLGFCFVLSPLLRTVLVLVIVLAAPTIP